MDPETRVTVAEVMGPSPAMINGLESVDDAIQIMKAKALRALIVERRHDGDEYGVITVRDVARLVADNRSTKRSSVYQIMTKPALTLSPDMNVKYALRLMTRLDEREALVMARSELLGFVDLVDLVHGYVESSEAAA